MTKILLGMAFAVLGLGGTATASPSCPQCVLGDAAVEKELAALSALAPEAQLESVRQTGACVRVLDSGRVTPGKLFSWGKAEAPKGRLDEVTTLKNLMGKTFCKGERPIAKDCATIVLASDAPRSTLLHEFLHLKQLEKDPSLCPVMKAIFEPAPLEARKIRDTEWDVHRLLWQHRAKLGFGIEDELTVAAETIEEAELRKAFDPDAASYVETEKLRERLAELISRYKTESAPTRGPKSVEGIAATSTGTKKQWKSLPVRLCIHEGVPEKFRPALREAASVWNRSFSKPLFNLSCSEASSEEKVGKTGDFAIRWISRDFARYGDKTVVARTLTEADDVTGEFVGASVLINAESFDWNARNLDLQSVALHELGHVLGLDHNPLWVDSVMGTPPYASGVRLRKLGAYERTAVDGAYFSGKGKLPPYLDAYLNEDSKGAMRLLEAMKPRASREDYALALLDKVARRLREAIALLERVVKKEPAHPRALYELGEAYWSSTRNREAEKAFRGVLTRNPNDYEALANLGSMAVNQEKPEDAKKYFEKALSLNPVHYVACFYLYQLSKEKRFKECVIRYSNDPELLDALRE